MKGDEKRLLRAWWVALGGGIAAISKGDANLSVKREGVWGAMRGRLYKSEYGALCSAVILILRRIAVSRVESWSGRDKVRIEDTHEDMTCVGCWNMN